MTQKHNLRKVTMIGLSAATLLSTVAPIAAQSATAFAGTKTTEVSKSVKAFDGKYLDGAVLKDGTVTTKDGEADQLVNGHVFIAGSTYFADGSILKDNVITRIGEDGKANTYKFDQYVNGANKETSAFVQYKDGTVLFGGIMIFADGTVYNQLHRTDNTKDVLNLVKEKNTKDTKLIVYNGVEYAFGEKAEDNFINNAKNEGDKLAKVSMIKDVVGDTESETLGTFDWLEGTYNDVAINGKEETKPENGKDDAKPEDNKEQDKADAKKARTKALADALAGKKVDVSKESKAYQEAYEKAFTAGSKLVADLKKGHEAGKKDNTEVRPDGDKDNAKPEENKGDNNEVKPEENTGKEEGNKEDAKPTVDPKVEAAQARTDALRDALGGKELSAEELAEKSDLYQDSYSQALKAAQKLIGAIKAGQAEGLKNQANKENGKDNAKPEDGKDEVKPDGEDQVKPDGEKDDTKPEENKGDETKPEDGKDEEKPEVNKDKEDAVKARIKAAQDALAGKKSDVSKESKAYQDAYNKAYEAAAKLILVTKKGELAGAENAGKSDALHGREQADLTNRSQEYKDLYTKGYEAGKTEKDAKDDVKEENNKAEDQKTDATEQKQDAIVTVETSVVKAGFHKVSSDKEKGDIKPGDYKITNKTKEASKLVIVKHDSIKDMDKLKADDFKDSKLSDFAKSITEQIKADSVHDFAKDEETTYSTKLEEGDVVFIKGADLTFELQQKAGVDANGNVEGNSALPQAGAAQESFWQRVVNAINSIFG